MDRRKFILNSIALAGGAIISTRLVRGSNLKSNRYYPDEMHYSIQGNKSKYSHRLPKTDQNYARLNNYIEDDPVPEYTWASDEAYEAFQDIKYGVRLHWGLYSIWNMRSESWPFLGNRTPKFDFKMRQDYQQLYKTWNPAGFDADEWVKTFKECGMKMFAFTTKHHEGFSMFDTKTHVRKRVDWAAPGGPKIEDCDLAYSIMETPFKRDVVKELCDAAHREGLKIDLYFSHTDFYDADFRPYGYHPLQIPSSDEYCKAKSADEEFTEYQRARERMRDGMMTIVPDPSPEDEARMVRRHRAQLKEILTNYGKIDMVCLDIWHGPRVWPQMRQTMLELRKLQPDVMFRARGIGNYGDYYTPEGFVPGQKENSDVPWFVIYPLGSSFSYDPDPSKYKGSQWILDNLIDSVAKGGNFMVGIGPDGNGKFLPEALAQLREVGKWLKINGEAIYATRARDGELWHEGDNIRFTRSKDNRTVYAFCREWPGEKLVLKSVTAMKKSDVYLLGTAKPLKWKNKVSGLEITLNEKSRTEKDTKVKMSYVFKILVA
jgi:alpha-L-fucosidase